MPGPLLNTAEDRERAVKVYMANGANIERTAVELGCNARSIYQWRNKEWWQAIEQRYADELRHEAVIRLRRSIVIAAQELEDRLRNGDTVVLAGGQTVRVPVRARDAAIVLDRLHGNLRLLEGKARTVNVTGTLKELSDMLRSGAKLDTLTIEGQSNSSQHVDTQDIPELEHG